MPRPVKILDPILANQIAAGEVVERPASAIKELIENALDAGSTEITVEILDGGRTLMRVADNGHGMTRDDALLALERHATSKISAVDDLNSISTLGFRGEALPSIASVSRFQLTTRAEGERSATQVRVEGGHDLKVSSAAGRIGTEIVVKDLFFSVPARRKFLKSAQTESGIIHESVQRIALAYPDVSFRFIKDGHLSLDIPRHHSTSERVRSLFGARIADHLCPVSWTGPVRARGLVSHPTLHFSAHRHAYVFINGRFVKDRLFLGAIQRAFGQRLPKGRYPFYLLHLDLHPSLVDVNVHPAKTQVRFVNEEALLDILVKAFKATLREMTFEEEPSWRARVVDQSALTSDTALGASGGSPRAEMSERNQTQDSSGDAVNASLEAHRQRIQARINRRLLGEGSATLTEVSLESAPTLEVPPSAVSSTSGSIALDQTQRDKTSGSRSSKRRRGAEPVIDSGRHEQSRVTQADLEAWKRGPMPVEPSESTTQDTSAPLSQETQDQQHPARLGRGDIIGFQSALGSSTRLIDDPSRPPLPPLNALPSPEAWSALRIVGRASAWWIQEADDGLLLTHLPTARAHAVTDKPSSVSLTQSAQLSVTAHEVQALEERQEILTELGIDLSLFGASSARLSALPRGLEDEPVSDVLTAIQALLHAPMESLRTRWGQVVVELPLSTTGRAFTLQWLSDGGEADPLLPPYSLPLPYTELSRRSQHLTPF